MGPDEHEIDEIRRTVRHRGVSAHGHAGDQFRHARAFVLRQLLRRQLLRNQPVVGRCVSLGPAQRDGRGEPQSEFDARWIVKLRLRHLHQQGLDGPDRDIGVNLPLHGGAHVAAKPVGDRVGGANTAYAAVSCDTLAAVVHRLHARMERHGFSAGCRDLGKVQIERCVFMNESESYALYRLQLSGQHGAGRQNGFARCISRIEYDRGDQDGLHGVAGVARVGTDGRQKADVKLGPRRNLLDAQQIECQQHISEAHGYLFNDRRIDFESGYVKAIGEKRPG